MSVKIPINTALHIVFGATIALLLAFIVREHTMNYDDEVQLLAQKTAQNEQSVMSITSKELMSECTKEIKDYPSARTEEYLALMQVITLKSDSIQYLADSLSPKDDIELLSAIQGMLPTQRSLILEMADNDQIIEAVLPNFLPSDWLYQSWKKNSKKQFNTVLEQAKINNLLMERIALNYVASKCNGDAITCWTPFPLLCNWYSIYPNIGDTVYADILIGNFPKKYPDQHFFVNGIPAPHQTFRQRFNKAGTYPLHIKVERDDWEHDRLLVAEKTYNITVRE